MSITCAQVVGGVTEWCSVRGQSLDVQGQLGLLLQPIWLKRVEVKHFVLSPVASCHSPACKHSKMVAEQVTFPDMEDVELMEADQLRDVLKQLIKQLSQNGSSGEGDGQGVDDKKFDENGQQTKVNGFKDKNISKPDPWDGEDEAGYKTWLERLIAHMSGAGDKIWKKIIKHIAGLDEDDSLEMDEEVEEMLRAVNVNPELREDLQDMLYDQLTQYTKKELLSDVQMAGPKQCFESLRRAMAYGRKKTAENIHRARNRVTRPEIAETMGQLEERYRSWKKDIAYLKEIGAYDFQDQTMISILMDFVPDEVHKEISMKHDTVGKKATNLKTIKLVTEKIIQREKGRLESRKDRNIRQSSSSLRPSSRPRWRPELRQAGGVHVGPVHQWRLWRICGGGRQKSKRWRRRSGWRPRSCAKESSTRRRRR